MNVRSDTGKAHSSSSRKIWEFFNCFWRCKIPSSVRNSGSTDTGNILIFQMEKLAVKALEQLLGGELSTGWLGCEFLRRSVCEQMTVFERQLDIDEMSNAQVWVSCLSPNGIDENRRRSRWWHRPVSAADTALELCVVQKASPCGEADSAPAKCQCGGFYGGFLQLRDICEFPGHVTLLTLVESLRSSRRVLKKRSSPVQVHLRPSPSAGLC
ncbi:uncharacterized protein LOC110362494 isoform X2 [Columba livia]|uniref:uncharacterized protein LOC110362494 isoform X2 n=1 Tax=Columba livia TaxID=8932 RepID=UPI0031BAA131